MAKMLVAPGVYQNSETKRFTYRPWVAGRRTERTLQATTLREALREYHKRVKEPHTGKTVEDICKLYIAAGAPNRAGMGRGKSFIEIQKRKIEPVIRHIGDTPAEELRASHCLTYRDRRLKTIRAGFSGLRTVDMELGVLSNAYHYAVLQGLLEMNWIANRPKFHNEADTVHCCDLCPRSGDELHLLSGALMQDPRSKPLGWQMLFEATSGCRTGEALPCRWDARAGEPGHIRNDKYLCIHRLKQGDNDPYDYIEINDALRKVLDGMRRERGSNRYFFESALRHGKCVDPLALVNAAGRVGRNLLNRRITSHGMRAFYVTWRRCQNIPLTKIAEEVGHNAGVALLLSVYGRRIPPWAQEGFGPYPSVVKTAW